MAKGSSCDGKGMKPKMPEMTNKNKMHGKGPESHMITLPKKGKGPYKAK